LYYIIQSYSSHHVDLLVLLFGQLITASKYLAVLNPAGDLPARTQVRDELFQQVRESRLDRLAHRLAHGSISIRHQERTFKV
jgi:hypothetical protein